MIIVKCKHLRGLRLIYTADLSAVQRSQFKAKKGTPTTLTMCPNSPESGIESLFILIDVIWIAGL